ncbi:MAG: hypothetical protein HYY00_04730 [Chloroflexi bacterium]|nr:hypothetical protein [Chloroflexota bacterium]
MANARVRVGVPHMGPYSYLAKKVVGELLREVGCGHISVEPAPLTTRKTVLRGWQLMDENMCLPAKITLGNILELADANVDAVLEWDACGDCRQKVYHILHRRVVDRLGLSLKIIPLRADGLKKGLQDLSLDKKQIKAVVRGTLRKLWEYDHRLMLRQAKPKPGAPRVGICGEIYTVLEPAANLDIVRRLEEQGAHVHNALPLSQFVLKGLLSGSQRRKWAIMLIYLGMWPEVWRWAIKGLRRPDVDYRLWKQAEEETEKYLPEYTIGGHGKESITWTIYYALSGYDGVIHILPFPCMPEAAVSALLDDVSRDYGIPVNHLVFDQQFGEQNLITRAEAMVNMLRFRKEGMDSILKARAPGMWLGVDVGSSSTKAALLDGNTLQVVDSEYQPTSRAPMEALKRVMAALRARHPDLKIEGMATTGSGRRLARALLSAPLAVDEITCQTVASLLTASGARSIVEIGGQDSKFISLDESGIPTWFNMNSICSAGTGAFLSSAAREFKVPVEEFGSRCRSCSSHVAVTGRCGVFAESDIVSKQQLGYPVDAIIKGMCHALAQNFVNNVCRAREPQAPVLFTGGVALNGGVADAFSDILKTEVIVHPHAKVSGAIGAALVAMARRATGGTGLDLADMDMATSTLSCKDCANECEVSLIHRKGSIVAAMGTKCGKWEVLIGRPSADAPKTSEDAHAHLGVPKESLLVQEV